jgi:hypothetical protein
MYITIDNIFFHISVKFLVIFVFCSIFLVQLCVILVSNNMFYLKNHQMWLQFFTM